MTSRELREPDRDDAKPASSEVHFALVIARMIETVKGDPEHMRQVIYDLARYKLQEQSAERDVTEIRQAEHALEAAIRGVEEFSRQQVLIPPPARAQLSSPSLPASPIREIDPAPANVGLVRLTRLVTRHPFWPVAKRSTFVLVMFGIALAALQQRERLALVGRMALDQQPISIEPPASQPVNGNPVAKRAPPDPLRPTDYGVYAIGNNALTELQLLPGRPPDVRVAISAAFRLPGNASVPNSNPKFIVFRRDTPTNILERAEVRVVARIAREFSTGAAGKRLEADDVWVIRNFSYPYRASPVADNPEMYELHSEDPALELPPGHYALILKSQAYYFSVEGNVVDPRQCIERVVTTNGTFYSACKKT